MLIKWVGIAVRKTSRDCRIQLADCFRESFLKDTQSTGKSLISHAERSFLPVENESQIASEKYCCGMRRTGESAASPAEEFFGL